MKNRLLSNLLKEEKGAALTVMVLILIPLLILSFVFQSELKRIYLASDNKLQNAVAISTKNATMMIDPESQAKGEPRIAYEKAFNTFKSNLQYNLALNTDMSGKDVSLFKNLKYWVLIYNGDATYSGYNTNNKVISYAYYTNQNGFEDVALDNSITGFPKTLYVNDTGITDTPMTNSISVTLTKPGVLTVVQSEVNKIFSSNTQLATRWAYAKITKIPSP